MKALLFSFSLSFLGIFLSFLLYSHNHGNRAVVPESDKQTSATVVLTLFRRFGRYLVGYGCTVGKEYMDGHFRSGQADRHQFRVQRRRESGSADFRHSTSWYNYATLYTGASRTFALLRYNQLFIGYVFISAPYLSLKFAHLIDMEEFKQCIVKHLAQLSQLSSLPLFSSAQYMTKSQLKPHR